MKAEITSVYDEGAMVETNLIGAKGFSVLVDINGEKTLFDAGLRGRYLLHNMSYLDIDPNSIGRVVISHAHKSNVKGLDSLLKEREESVKVLANSQFPSMKNIIGKPLFDQESQNKIDYQCVDSVTEINEYLSVVGPFGELEELFLLVKSRDGPVVIGSCYHCGLRPVFEKIKEITGSYPIKLIGGIHLPKAKQKNVVPVAEFFKEYGLPELHLNHCAGPNGIMYLRAETHIDAVKDFYVGMKLNLDL